MAFLFFLISLSFLVTTFLIVHPWERWVLSTAIMVILLSVITGHTLYSAQTGWRVPRKICNSQKHQCCRLHPLWDHPFRLCSPGSVCQTRICVGILLLKVAIQSSSFSLTIGVNNKTRKGSINKRQWRQDDKCTFTTVAVSLVLPVDQGSDMFPLAL